MQCPECEGKGFKEYNAGLLQVGCEACNGTGEVEEIHSELHEVVENRGEFIGKVTEIKERKDGIDVKVALTPDGEEKLKEIGILTDDNSNTGIVYDSRPIGSGNTCESKQPKKSKAKAKLSKRAG